MVFGIVTKENLTLFGMVTLGLAFFSLIFIPLDQWGFIVEWFMQTPIVTIFGQSVLFLTSCVLITAFLLIIKELI